MRALLQRLSALDADAKNAVRIITLFDKLVQQHIWLTALVRSTALFSECTVGVTDPVGHVGARAAADGRPLEGAKPVTVTSHPVDGGGGVARANRAFASARRHRPRALSGRRCDPRDRQLVPCLGWVIRPLSS